MNEHRGYLLGYGHMAWDEAHSLLGGYQAVWADLDGWHVRAESLPAKQPVATHLWAWKTDDDCWARVRFDEDSAIVGILVGSDVDLPPSEGPDPQPVEYKVYDGVPWGNDQQIPPGGDEIRKLVFKVAKIHDIDSIEFVKILKT